MIGRSSLGFVGVFCCAIAAVWTTTGAIAGTTGVLNGAVTSDRGVPIAGARVTATSPSQTEATTTGTDGRFAFLSLAPDAYRIEVRAQGFDPIAIDATIYADRSLSVSLPLRPHLIVLDRHHFRSEFDLVRPGMTSDYSRVRDLLMNTLDGLRAVPAVFVSTGAGGASLSR